MLYKKADKYTIPNMAIYIDYIKTEINEPDSEESLCSGPMSMALPQSKSTKPGVYLRNETEERGGGNGSPQKAISITKLVAVATNHRAGDFILERGRGVRSSPGVVGRLIRGMGSPEVNLRRYARSVSFQREEKGSERFHEVEIGIGSAVQRKNP